MSLRVGLNLWVVIVSCVDRLVFNLDFFDDSPFSGDKFGSFGEGVGGADFHEVGEFFEDLAGVVEGLFGEPGVEEDLEVGEVFFLLGQHHDLRELLPVEDGELEA